MNRRGFLRSLIGAAAVVPAVRTWPFRTFFIPAAPRLSPEAARRMLEHIRRALAIDEPFYIDSHVEANDQIGEYAGLSRAPYPGPLISDLQAIELEQVRAEIPELFRPAAIWNHFRDHERIVLVSKVQRSPIRWTSRNDPLRFP